jgi:hypothetical protein
MNIEIAVSDSARGMDVSACFCVVLYCVSLVGLIPQPRCPVICLWIEKSIKEGLGPIRAVEAS